MSGKRSIPKPKPKRKAKRNDFTYFMNLIQKIRDNHARDYDFLTKRIDGLARQNSEINTNLIAHISRCGVDSIYLRNRIDDIVNRLNYNQIYPEPKNRWIPSTSYNEEYIREREAKEKDTNTVSL